MDNCKLGMICRADDGGLGIESREFFTHLQPDRVICVLGTYQNYPDRFPGAVQVSLEPSDAECEAFLSGLDVVFSIETTYNAHFFEIAKTLGVRTVLRANFEWLEDWMRPDVLVLPNTWHHMHTSWFAKERTMVIPTPIDPTRFKYRQRTKAKTFLHVMGHDAGYDRSGTEIVAQAIPMMKADISFLIRSQLPHYRTEVWRKYPKELQDPRIKWIDQDLPDNASLYEEADVLVMPRRYGGQSLVIEEAAMCGLPLITTWMEPQNQIFSRAALFIDPHELSRIRIKQEIEYSSPRPEHLATMIDAMASLPTVSYLSEQAHEAVCHRSWEPWNEALRPK